jgi:hypothetical protein
MDKLNDYELNDYLLNERTICYWFWFKGRVIYRRSTGEILVTSSWRDGLVVVNGIQRLQNGFYNCFDIMSGKWNGQSKAEFEKNKVRVSDIWTKSDGDIEKAKSLSRTQAMRITDEYKALNRAMCAKEMGHIEIFEVFFHRAYELGSVSKQEYREYRLEKLGI